MAESSTPSDEELLRLMLDGNEAAFTGLYRRRQAGVYRFVLQMSGSKSIAEDVTQEVFMALIRGLGQFDATRGPLSPYLYGVARKLLSTHLERDRAYLSMVDDSGDDLDIATEAMIAPGDPLGDLTRNETIESVRQAVLALPARYREVVVLCDLQELSYVEAASALDCAVGTVRSRLHRARALLVERLREPGSVSRAVGSPTSLKRCYV